MNGAEAEIVQAKASLNQAQVNLSHTIIKAPIDGVVIARNVDVGQTVASSLQAPTLFILARDLTEMQVNASVDESDIGEIAPKQDVRFRVDAYPNETFTGKVRQVRLQPVVQQNVVSYITVIDVPNPGAEAETGNDGGRDHRDCSGRRRAEGAERGVALRSEERVERCTTGAGQRPWIEIRRRQPSRGLGARAGSADARTGPAGHQRWQRHRDSRRRSDAGNRSPHRNLIDVGAGSGRTSHITAAPLRTTRRRRRESWRRAMSETPVISVRELTKTYAVGEIEVRALRGISLDISRGEFVALTGPSGSGKSTFMHLAGCLDRPTSGIYELNGRDVSRLTKRDLALVRNREIGFVFQGFNLLARTSAIENVELPLLYGFPVPAKERHRRAAAALEAVGLGTRLDHHPNQLSGGQQQRVAIARALVNNPSLLLADEPTGNLDSRTSIEVMGIFQRLNTEQGITIVLVTHEPDIAEYATRIVGFRDGRVRLDRPVPQRREAAEELRRYDAEGEELSA